RPAVARPGGGRMSRTRVRPGRGDPGRQVVSGATSASIAPIADEPPTVVGLVYAPCRGRARYLILVRVCCWCRHSHRHVSEVLARVYWRACPVTGRRYAVAARIDRDTASRRVRHG